MQRHSISRFAICLVSFSLWAFSGCTPDDAPQPQGYTSAIDGFPADIECQGVEVAPTVDLGAEVADKPNGTTFCLSAGTFRISAPLVLKQGQKLIGVGDGDTVISGAKAVSATKEGSYWVITGQTSLGTSGSGSLADCLPVEGKDPGSMCIYQDQVFLDDRSLWQVGSLGELSSGEFLWDYGANKIYLADDPSGRKLELSVATAGLSGGSGVELKNLVVEKFGNEARNGTISASFDWLITGVEARLNHGGGIRMGPGTVVRASFVHHNGQLGIVGGQISCSRAKGLILAGSELSYNNAAGYNYGWEGGASKWTHTDGLIVRNNYVHDNYGSGLWTDGPNINVVFEGNRVEDNDSSGISHELGYAAVIRDNVVRGNGFGHPIQGDVWGAGIRIATSRDVEVYGNTVEDNNAGITATQDDRSGDQCGFGADAEVANLYVHDNTVVQPAGIATGLRLVGTDDSSYQESKGNRWNGNTYVVGDPSGGGHFFWGESPITAVQWQGLGEDVDGSVEDIG